MIYNNYPCNTIMISQSLQNTCICNIPFKVALGVCFALKLVERFTSFHIFNNLCKDVTFPLITKFKTNEYLSYLSVNRIPN